jgi:uncharacterized protein
VLEFAAERRVRTARHGRRWPAGDIPGQLVSAVINNNVLFEADEHNVAEGWSVIVKGMARTLRTDEEIVEAEQAQLIPWTATVKQHYVRIRPLSVTGRRFYFGPEPYVESTAT